MRHLVLAFGNPTDWIGEGLIVSLMDEGRAKIDRLKDEIRQLSPENGVRICGEYPMPVMEMGWQLLLALGLPEDRFNSFVGVRGMVEEIAKAQQKPGSIADTFVFFLGSKSPFREEFERTWHDFAPLFSQVRYGDNEMFSDDTLALIIDLRQPGRLTWLKNHKLTAATR